MTTRKHSRIDEEELNNWKEYFALPGTRADLERETKISRPTLIRVLASGHAEERIVTAIRNYYTNQQKPA